MPTEIKTPLAVSDDQCGRVTDRNAKPLSEKPPFLVVPASEYESHDTLEKLEQSLVNDRGKIGYYGKYVLRVMTVSGEVPDSDVEFVKVSNAELGYPNGCTVEQAFEAAAKFGLELCCPEDGPLARIAYKDQPMGDWRLMAMKPIADSNGYPKIFGLKHNYLGLWLCCDKYPSNFCNGNIQWVFRRKRST